MTFNKNDFEGKQRFSIRKLNIGVCSVLLSTLLWTMNTSQTVHADTTDPVETEEVESAKKTTTDTGNDQTTTADKNDNDTTAQKEVSGTDPLTSKNSTEQNSTKQAEDKKATSPEDTKDVSTQNNKEVSYSAYNKSGDPGQQTTFTQGTDSYQPNYIISRLQTNADGLVSGKQNATIRVTVPNGTLGAQYDADGKKLDGVPTDAGTYQAHLNANTLVALQKANPNYAFSSVNGVINYTISPAQATATIGGSANRNYDAQTTSVTDVMDNIKWSSTSLVIGQELNTAGLTANSYAWYTKDNDDHYVAMTGNPVKAGTYYLRLTDAAIAQIKADNPNYNFTAVDGEFTYTINAVAGQATLSGSASKTYDGQAVTTAEVDSTNGNVIAHFSFPGSTSEHGYTLQDGDYTWETEDSHAPTNAGTYTIKLSANGIVNLQKALNQYAGQGNVTLDAEYLLGSATYTIKQKDLNVVLDGNSKGADGKTYDGQPATINT